MTEHPDSGCAGDRIRLRIVLSDDVALFFQHQRDSVASQMAAFTAEDPDDWNAFSSHWKKILKDGAIIRTVLLDDIVVGHVACFERLGKPEVGYWIERDHWGKGVATEALTGLLEIVKLRPLFARVAKDNVASLRVLEKCGFSLFNKSRGFSHARSREVEELILSIG